MSYKSLKEKMESKDKYLLLDVRSRSEYKSGHIPGSRCIPHDKIALSPPKVNKDSEIIVYCRTGSRAKHGKKTLEARGFTNVVNFGGISRWKEELSR
jgi:rhodanese-related sulfurtransferase